MKKESKNKKSAKKTAAPAKAAPKKPVKQVAKPAPKAKAKKPAKKSAAKKKPAANSTGAQIADLLKSTLVNQETPAPIAKKVETIPLSAAAPAPTLAPAVAAGAKLNAQTFRPTTPNLRVVRPFTRFRAAGI